MRAHKLTTEIVNARLAAVADTRLVEALEILPPIGRSNNKRARFRCACGAECVKDVGNALHGLSRSCGCLSRGVRKLVALDGTDWSFLPGVDMPMLRYMRRRWRHMINRCHQPSNTAYKWYGARGISVCEQWRNSFRQFMFDMGMPASIKLSIDRIDNDGNYEPGNCRWATASEQQSNKRSKAEMNL